MFEGLVDGHLKDFGDVLAGVADAQGLGVVASALADLAQHFDIGQKLHGDALIAFAAAGGALAGTFVEAEAADPETQGAGFGQA